jgi:His/Glu/Gln/Arg/opine family amino acid ABC transporter permease subunit
MGKVFDAGYMVASFGEILKGLPVALLITAVAFSVGLVIGLFSALVKIYKIPVLKRIVAFYVSFFRGTPLLVQLYVSYYGLALLISYLSDLYNWNINIGKIPAIYFALVAFSLNTGAYLTETIRSAIESVDPGQYEAAYSIGMTNRQTFTRIVLPQAFLWVLPNLGNTVISLIKDTSLAFSITVLEIIGVSKVIGSRSLRYTEVFLSAAIIYWITCIVMEILVNRLEKRMRRKRGLA